MTGAASSGLVGKAEKSTQKCGSCMGKMTPLLWGLVIAGVYLRLTSTERLPLWEDEWWTVWRTNGSFLKTYYSLRKSPFPPLHYLIVWCWRAIWSGELTSIRCVASGMGVAGIAAVLFAWRRILPNHGALWAAAFVSLSGFHFHYSCDAKMYSSVWLWSTLGCGLYLHCLLRNPNRWHYAGLAIANGCVVLTSYVGVLSLGIQALFCCYVFIAYPERRRRLFAWLFTTGIGLIPAILWIDFALRAATQRTAGTWMPPAETVSLPMDVFRLFSLWLSGVWMGNCQPSDHWTYLFLLLAPMSLLLFAATLFACLRQPNDSVSAESSRLPHGDARLVFSFLLLWLLFPIVAAAVFSLFVYSMWGVPRYLTGCSPAVPLILAYAITATPRLRMPMICGILVLITNAASIQFAFKEVTRTPWDQVTETVRVASLAAGREPPLQVLYQSHNGRYVNPIALRDELKRSELPLEPQVEAFSRESLHTTSSAFVIMRSSGAKPRFNGDSQELPLGATHVMLMKAVAREEKYSRLPAPFDTAFTEVWLCQRK